MLWWVEPDDKELASGHEHKDDEGAPVTTEGWLWRLQKPQRENDGKKPGKHTCMTDTDGLDGLAFWELGIPT